MSKCMSCGGFVTDTYARVFGDNDDTVYDCRSCRADSPASESDANDAGGDGKVLLRSVRGDDEAYSTGRGDASTAADPSADNGEAGTGTDEPATALADGGLAAGAADDDPVAVDPEADDGADDGGRFGVRQFFSSLRL